MKQKDLDLLKKYKDGKTVDPEDELDVKRLCSAGLMRRPNNRGNKIKTTRFGKNFLPKS